MDITAQTHAVKNIQVILQAAGADLEDVVDMTTLNEDVGF